jgi:hypothetical protein
MAYYMHGRDEKCEQNFTQKETAYLGDSGINEKIIIQQISRK